uniref:Uncharacterized protein n=1 Tax=Myoviridae sp. ctdyF5 TaxID=2825144 RepID=A0A8S5U7L0_9CAUD|nr:MAG TPA: hypothetical protein [Myoviridae sp. ctdyF5]
MGFSLFDLFSSSGNWGRRRHSPQRRGCLKE